MSFDNSLMERLSDSDSGYYPDSHPLELDENSDVSKVISPLLRCSKTVFVVE